jgi:hypothetical protein
MNRITGAIYENATLFQLGRCVITEVACPGLLRVTLKFRGTKFVYGQHLRCWPENQRNEQIVTLK